MELSRTKPFIPKFYLKELRKFKWKLADIHCAEIRKIGFTPIIVDYPKTPHIKVANIDYWPASSRWFCNRTRMLCCGFDNLIKYLQEAKIHFDTLLQAQLQSKHDSQTN